VNISSNGGKRTVTLRSKERVAISNVQPVLKDLAELLDDDDAKVALEAVAKVEAKYPVAVKA